MSSMSRKCHIRAEWLYGSKVGPEHRAEQRGARLPGKEGGRRRLQPCLLPTRLPPTILEAPNPRGVSLSCSLAPATLPLLSSQPWKLRFPNFSFNVGNSTLCEIDHGSYFKVLTLVALS